MSDDAHAGTHWDDCPTCGTHTDVNIYQIHWYELKVIQVRFCSECCTKYAAEFEFSERDIIRDAPSDPDGDGDE
ncbi:hypothetical protein B4589_009765 [Halolamina sp. CBA1230]|uniref:hypothetical protein n=1 Tax=Halolamina sp. CBA1230 TaxID=1853690 RepID=UPI00117BA5BF|nr:hypothetical protein [Halolamina sp. CBA1230]QKY20651.1 hypothetical protein B4589_009765 [Halolamina sp. CBA1230]